MKLSNLFALSLLMLVAVLFSFSAHAGGMVVHMFQSEKALEQLPNSELKQLLTQNPNALYSGTQYPDVGYGLDIFVKGSHVWGEASHWSPFIEAYMEVVIEQCQGKYLSDSKCSELTAHFLGAAAHGIQDQVFDNLFIPKVTEVDRKGQETTDPGIDMVVLREHNRKHVTPKPWYTPSDQLALVYQRMGFTDADVNRIDILAATKVSEAGHMGEHFIAPFLYWHFKKQMPWGSRNYMAYPGGVEFGGLVTANFWQHLWQQLNGVSDADSVNVTVIPAPNATHVAVNKHATDNKVSVTFDRYVMPSSVNDTSFRVVDEYGRQINGTIDISGSDLPANDLFATDTMILFQPQAPLDFDMRYRVVLTSSILDRRGQSIFGILGFEWSFTTELSSDYQQLSSQNYCLGLRRYEPGSTSIGVELQTCEDTRHQHWYADINNHWHNRLRPDLCLQVDGDRAQSWKRINANTCNPESLQQWVFSGDSHQFKLQNDEYVMGTFFNAWAGIELRLFRHKTNSRQHWDSVPVP